MTKFPEKFIRGISDPSFVDNEGRVSSGIFQFLENKERNDNFLEASINWYDEEKALTLILEQRKKNNSTKFQFSFGAAIISRSEADRLKNTAKYKSIFDYERYPLDNNQYHGNLLFLNSPNIKNFVKDTIRACLVLNAKVIIR
ncbi:MAG: hypothetical protein LBR53_12305 [Deltaproteobacteria bacterium]|jgi:hypothetical protein|nr:hypothetical protein [Deltaproteobacteria bacterium]